MKSKKEKLEEIQRISQKFSLTLSVFNSQIKKIFDLYKEAYISEIETEYEEVKPNS